MAERVTRRIYVEWLDGPARTTSPCCHRSVIVAPDARTGLCPACTTVLSYTGSGWRHRTG